MVRFLRATTATMQQCAYVGLVGLFLNLCGAFSTRLIRGDGAVRPFDFALLAKATFRIGRMVSNEQILTPLRGPFTATTPDESDDGDITVPEGSGVRRALGELMSCPICGGTRGGRAANLRPAPRAALMTTTGAAGAAELLGAATEALSWIGADARQRVG